MASVNDGSGGTVAVDEAALTALLEALEKASHGDFSVRLRARKGSVMGDIAAAYNGLAERNSELTKELVRVARVVGREGRMTERVKLDGQEGAWGARVDSVNALIDDLVRPTAEVARVIVAVAEGDLSQKIPLKIEGQAVKGEFLRIGTAVNAMVDQLGSFADEVTRVAREVGTEGKLGGQAQVPGVSGTWKDLTDSVNFMAGNLTSQVRNIAQVTTAVANGDLSQKITVDVKGEILELKNTINVMVDQLGSFAAEVTRVAREVGTEGKLGGQAEVPGVSGTWKDLTDNVNFMAGNLTSQVRNIAQVATAVARGDLSQKITVEAKGEVAVLADTLNSMTDTLRVFAEQVTGVAREVGTEGKLGGQAEVPGVSGTWKDLTDNVNFMAGNLTSQVRNIAQVATAVARGDLSQTISVEAKGEVAVLAGTINTMVDQLRSFAAEVTRVAREVGTEGKLGGQAEVPGVSGTWKDLTDSVNFMAGNLTSQVRNIAQVTTAVANGDLSQKITVDVKGEILELKNTINVMVDQLGSFAAEVTRVAREVGTEGKLGGQAQVTGVSGTWKDLTDNVNFMAGNLTGQVRNIAQVATAVARGDLSQKITVQAKGEVATLADTINTMVDQLRSFAAEVTRVAREVGTEGKLGGQADVPGVSGTWKDLTDNVNLMAGNLTDQVRNIAQVTTAVARGDLSQQITVDAKGEILELKNTINTMVNQLGSFAAEVTRVAREVGTEGQLGGQAEVEGVSGTWKRLTENVNQLAANLTTQVRAIAEVSTAVTSGDLTRSITVQAQGEVAELKDNINQMIANLRTTTQKSAEQDWLKSNLARIGGMMQGQRDLLAVSRLIMSELTPVVSAQHGAFFLAEADEDGDAMLRLIASYGYKTRKSVSNRFAVGEALVGQAALEKKTILITEAPPDYIRISSGLGDAPPVNIIVCPVLFEDQVLAVIELASFRPFSEVNQTFLDQLVETIGVVLNTIMANMRTEELLEQSQSLTMNLQSQSEELQAQQEELQQTNEELEQKALLLAEQNRNIEVKNREIAEASQALEQRAQQLALSSRYKSEFLANMSHELRTPLNSLLILAKLLAANPDANLTAKQVEFAATIHDAGNDLLALISDILDLSKIEAGKMEVMPAPLSLPDVTTYVQQTFGPVAEQRGLALNIEIDPAVPATLVTDEQRLQQILRNLVSNACKFTEQGEVTLRVGLTSGGPSFGTEALRTNEPVVAFSVVDTGIGISPASLQEVFEAFHQADGTTSRKYGGTGLGLSISRELARLLGGEIHVESAPGQGSTFTLHLPVEHPAGLSANDALVIGPGADVVDVASGERTLLVVCWDPGAIEAARTAAAVRRMKVVTATDAHTAVALAEQYQPASVVVDASERSAEALSILAQLTRNPGTRHIGVHVLGVAEDRAAALRSGATSFLDRPLDLDGLSAVLALAEEEEGRSPKRLLVVEDDEAERTSIIALVGGDDVEVIAVGTSAAAVDSLREGPFDCVVLDLNLPDTSGFDLLEIVRADPVFQALPVIVYTGRDLTAKDETRLRRYATTVIVKTVGSPERLLEETALFLRRAERHLGVEQRTVLEKLQDADGVFQGRQILVVDDDVRNLFALTSALENRGMVVLVAENGREGLEVLAEHPGVDLVVMDIMMPELDGYETMRTVRAMPAFARLPIIALTAKAMQEDREKSIAAGASDYVTKPVDIEQLLSLMRVWLYQ